MSVALKEANETEYWLELLFMSEYIDKNVYEVHASDLTEILRLPISIIKSSKVK